MSGNLSITDLKKMDKRQKIKVYAGGEFREITAGYLLRLKQDKAKKDRLKKSKKGRK